MEAVGEAEAEAEGETDDDLDPPDGSGRAASVLQAHHRLLEATIGRAVRRLATHAVRAAKRGDAAEAIYEVLLEHRTAVEEMLELPLAAASSLLGEPLPAAHLAIFAGVRSALADCADAEQVQAVFAELERSLPAIAADIISQETTR